MDDPRDRVTPTAFRIAPDLLGVALATPPRRAAALAVDLLLAAVVSAVGGGAAAGLAAAVLFFLVAMRRGSRHPIRRTARAALVSVGAVILFGVGVAVVGGPDDDEDPVAEVSGWDDSGGAEIAAEVERGLAEAGIAVDLSGATPDADPLSAGERAEAAERLRAYADALVARDTVATDSLGPGAARLVAGPALRERDARIEALHEQVRDLDGRNESLQEALDDPSFVRTFRTLAGDFGLTLGWIGVYFTLVLAWWGGYTPGKRLMGIRVVRLDGRPISLWTAFERFGGYAAGLATGLVGFAQVLWDANRQGVQDKIAGTAVIRMDDPRTPRRVG